MRLRPAPVRLAPAPALALPLTVTLAVAWPPLAAADAADVDFPIEAVSPDEVAFSSAVDRHGFEPIR